MIEDLLCKLALCEDCTCPQIKAHYLLVECITCWYDHLVCLQGRLNKCVITLATIHCTVFGTVWRTVHETERTGLNLVLLHVNHLGLLFFWLFRKTMVNLNLKH